MRYASLLLCAVLTGIAASVLVLELALRQLDGPDYIRVRQAEYLWFTWFIAVVAVPTLIAVVLLVIQERKAHSRALRPAAIALALLLLMVVITAVVNGPINVQQHLNWNPQAPPADWAAVRDRWQIAHAIRTVACGLALGFLTAAVLPRRPGGDPGPDARAGDGAGHQAGHGNS